MSKQLLDSVTQQALDKIFEKWSLERLLQCFPSIADAAPEALEKVHEQIREFVVSSILKDYGTINANRNLAEMLGKIDAMRAEGQSLDADLADLEPNPQPKDPELIRRATLAKIKREHLSQLEELLALEKQKFADNVSAIQEDSPKLKQLEDSVSRLTETHLDSVMEALGSVPNKEVDMELESYRNGLR